MSALFHIIEDNPNNMTRRACVCHSDAPTSCVGPFAIFPGQELDDPAAPHVVISEACLRECVAQITKERKQLALAVPANQPALPFDEPAEEVNGVVVAEDGGVFDDLTAEIVSGMSEDDGIPVI